MGNSLLDNARRMYALVPEGQYYGWCIALKHESLRWIWNRFIVPLFYKKTYALWEDSFARAKKMDMSPKQDLEINHVEAKWSSTRDWPNQDRTAPRKTSTRCVGKESMGGPNKVLRSFPILLMDVRTRVVSYCPVFQRLEAATKSSVVCATRGGMKIVSGNEKHHFPSLPEGISIPCFRGELRDASLGSLLHDKIGSWNIFTFRRCQDGNFWALNVGIILILAGMKQMSCEMQRVNEWGMIWRNHDKQIIANWRYKYL